MADAPELPINVGLASVANDGGESFAERVFGSFVAEPPVGIFSYQDFNPNRAFAICPVQVGHGVNQYAIQRDGRGS